MNKIRLINVLGTALTMLEWYGPKEEDIDPLYYLTKRELQECITELANSMWPKPSPLSEDDLNWAKEMLVMHPELKERL